MKIFSTYSTLQFYSSKYGRQAGAPEGASQSCFNENFKWFCRKFEIAISIPLRLKSFFQSGAFWKLWTKFVFFKIFEVWELAKKPIFIKRCLCVCFHQAGSLQNEQNLLLRLFVDKCCKSCFLVGYTFLQKFLSFKHFSILEENCGADIKKGTFKM